MNMDFMAVVSDRFRLPRQHLKHLSEDRLVCLVDEDWLRHAVQGDMVGLGKHLAQAQCQQLMAASLLSPPPPWRRVTIKCVHKSSDMINSLFDGSLCNLSPKLCLTELMAHISRENYTNLWQEAARYFGPNQLKSEGKHQEEFKSVFRQWILRLQPLAVIDLDETDSDTDRPYTGQIETSLCFNTVPILALLETRDTFFVLQPYYQHSLQDIVHFSPALFSSSQAKFLFVLYQILQTLRMLHERGLSGGDLNLASLRIDTKLWVYLSTPQSSKLICRTNHTTQSKCHTPSSPATSQVDNPISLTEPLTDQVTGQDNTQNSLTNEPSPNIGNSNNSNGREEKTRIINRQLSEISQCRHFLDNRLHTAYTKSNLSSLVDDWVHRRISNFEYLMVLNYLAGRRMGDPNNHPVLPWVMDFSCPDGGYRDLTMSKYRLNKGERQLDIMYESLPFLTSTSTEPTLTQTPHHISDVLSDITYYVYKARVTPKDILCAHVRTKWVPNEYPSSMQRMQNWTPDECIPEFFTDYAIFTSIHEDLPDLEVPPWCSSPHDFIKKHLAVLESDHISSKLNHWIDLTFGHQLSSQAAVKSKNVHLHLADEHTHVTNHGVVQLFSQPHPYRSPTQKQSQHVPPKVTQNVLFNEIADVNSREPGFSFLLSLGSGLDNETLGSGLQVPGEHEAQALRRPSSSSSLDSVSSTRPEHATIKLPPSIHDPISALDHLEMMYEFSSKTMQCLPPSAQSKDSLCVRSEASKHDVVSRDMQAFACMMCELFYASQIRMSSPGASLTERYKLLHKVYQNDTDTLPRPIRHAAHVLLHLESSKKGVKSNMETGLPLFVYELVDSSGLPPPNPALLLNPNVDILPFPQHYSDIYECLYSMQQKEFEIEKVRLSCLIYPERLRWMKVLAREKVTILEKFLNRTHLKLSEEELEIVLPHAEELFDNENTAVQAAWHLFNIVGKAMGPRECKKRFLKYVTRLLSGESSTPKHMKLYHRVFLLQCMIRLGIQSFLTNFSTLLVEAVAGYKDFVITSPTDEPDTEADEDVSETEKQLTSNSYDDSRNITENMDDGSDSESDSETDNEISLVTDSSAPGNDELDDDEDFPDDVSISDMDDVCEEDGERQSYSRSKRRNDHEDSVSESSAILSYTGEGGDATLQDMSNDSEDRLHYGIGSVGNESIHSLSRLIAMSRNTLDSTGAESDMDIPESQGDLDAVFDIPHPDLEDSADPKEVDQSDVKVRMGHVDSSGETTPTRGVSNGKDMGENNVDVTPQESIRRRPMPKPRLSMVRSETDEFTSAYSSHSSEHHVNICDVALDSIKWLCHRLGPVLTAKYLSRNLIRMLGLCYLGEEQLELLMDQGHVPMQSCQLVIGDKNAWRVLESLGHVAKLYGERVVLSQFFPCIADMISVCMKRLTVRAEAGLIGVIILLRHATQFLSDKTLMDILQDTLIGEMLLPLIRLVSLSSLSFPSGPRARSIACYKIVDVIYIVGLRIGFEMTRKHMTSVLKRFFATFDWVHAQPKTGGDVSAELMPVRKLSSTSSPGTSIGSSDDTYLNIKMDSETNEYSIGTPVSVSHLASPQSPANSLGSWKMRQYSLTPAVNEDRDEPCENRTANKEKILEELLTVFSPALAFAAYIPLCRIFGSIHIEQHLRNDDLIRQLCSQHDQMLAKQNTDDQGPNSPTTDPMKRHAVFMEEEGSTDLGSNVAVVGNRIQLQDEPVTPIPVDFSHMSKGLPRSGILAVNPEKLHCAEMNQYNGRHLKGNWLAYWEHELGLSERETVFNFKQIKLQTFLGHNNSIRALSVMDNENSFISASKDKTVKLWSLRSVGDGSTVSRCQWSYSKHKKSVFSVAFVETMRYVASCDSTVHVWDPFTGMGITQLDSSKHHPVLALVALPSPNPHLLTATTEATLRFLDLRVPKYAQEFKCTINSAGLIRCVTVSPNSDWVAVGYSSGHISRLDLRTGLLLGAWKGHDSEILQIKAYNKNSFVTSSFDQTLKLWNVEDSKDVCHFKGPTEPVHCFSFYNNQIISATTANRIGVHTSVDAHASFTSTRLRSDTFKGVLTCMSVLPLNRTLVIGADNGSIRLLC